MLAGMCSHYTDELQGKKTLSRLDFFIAQLALSLPIGLFGLLLKDIVDKKDVFHIPDSRISSFLVLLLFYPIINFLSNKKEDILDFIETSKKEDLKKYSKYYFYILITSALLFMLIVLLLQ